LLFSSSIPETKATSTWLHRWIYYLTAGFMFAAVTLRSVLVYQDSPVLSQIFILLTAMLFAFIGNIILSGKSSFFTALLISLEFLFVLALLLTTRSDFFAFLFAIICMQAMQQYPPRVVGFMIGLTALSIFLILLQPYGILQSVALTLAFAGVSVFLVTYIWSTRRARDLQEQQQVLADELKEANRQLEFSSLQQQKLAVGRERQRLARELHDSVTQTIFSMTLTTQSALLLLERDPHQVAVQLDHLNQLSQSALAEMQVLISRLAPENVTGDGFINALQLHLAERRRLENLTVFMDVIGDQVLEPAEETCLFRIAQEALNNIVKHAQVSEAVLRLHLTEPFWMMIEDQGAGFDPQVVHAQDRLGLASMRERATEIGWTLHVVSSPGNGTCIQVEKDSTGGEQE
jgi:signal transduction histidine kinase